MPAAPDGGGPSLERRRAPAYGNDSANWVAGANGGSPGWATPKVVIGDVANGAGAGAFVIAISPDIVWTNGAVTRVELLEGTNRLQTAAGPPFVFTWSNAVMGARYTLSVRITDSQGTAQSPPVTIALPIVEAGPDQVVSRFVGSVALDGRVVVEGQQETNAAAAWSRCAGPASAVIADPADLDGAVSFSEPGLYTFCLTATYGSLAFSDWMTVTVVESGGSNTVPYREAFEAYAPEARLAGRDGWGANGPDAAVVTASPTNAYTGRPPLANDHRLVLHVHGAVSNRFADTQGYSNLWIDTVLNPGHWVHEAPPPVPPNMQFMLYVATNSALFVWHREGGTNTWSALPQPRIGSNEWFRLTAQARYEAGLPPRFRLWINSAPVTNPATWWTAAQTNASRFGGIRIHGDAFVDDLVVDDYNMLEYWRLDATANAFGTVTPSGRVLVTNFGSQAFSLEPSAYSRLDDVIVDETNSLGVVSNVVFASVTADRTLQGRFAPELAVHDVPHRWLASRHPAWTNDFDFHALDDADRDGLKTWEEYVAGTDPTNDSSLFTVRIADSNGAPTVWFRTVAAQAPDYDDVTRYYELQASTSLTAGAWAALPALARLPGTGNVVAFTNSPGQAMRLFRARTWLE